MANKLNICKNCGAKMEAIAEEENPELLKYFYCPKCKTKYYLTID